MSLTLLISAGMGAYQVAVHNYHCNIQLILDFQDLLYQSLNLAKTEVPWQVHMPYPGHICLPEHVQSQYTSGDLCTVSEHAVSGDTFLHACAIDSGVWSRFAGYFAACCSLTEAYLHYVIAP